MPLYTAFARLNDKSDDLPDPNWLPVGSAFKLAKAEDKTALEPEDSAEVLAAASNKGRSLKPTDLQGDQVLPRCPGPWARPGEPVILSPAHSGLNVTFAGATHLLAP